MVPTPLDRANPLSWNLLWYSRCVLVAGKVHFDIDPSVFSWLHGCHSGTWIALLEIAPDRNGQMIARDIEVLRRPKASAKQRWVGHFQRHRAQSRLPCPNSCN